MYSRILLLLIACLVVLCANASAQQADRQKILAAIAKDGCTQLDQVKVCKYDYVIEGNRIEALSFQPAGEGKFPGLLLIPGYQRSAPDYLNLGRILGQQGFASVAVTQPGFGKSEGKADYVGPNTIYALKAGFDKFQHEPYVDKKKMGIFGYSRGGMAITTGGETAGTTGGGVWRRDLRLQDSLRRDQDGRHSRKHEIGIRHD